MNLIYDKRIKCMLCPKCFGPADWDDNGNLQCEWEECGYLYIIFLPEGTQLELDFN